MKKFVVIFIFLFAKDIYSIDYDISGYVYELPVYNTMPDIYNIPGIEYKQESFTNLTRIRLTPELYIGDNGKIVLHYEMNMLYSDMGQAMFGSIGKTNRQAVNLSNEITQNGDFSLTHFIDRLYYKHTALNWEFAFGRQRIAWGSGRIWQPTDLFNPINPANFSKTEKDGADAASIKYFIGNFSDIEFVYNFRERWEYGNFGARYRTNISEYDLAAIAGYFDKRAVLGGDFAGNLFDAGVRGELVYSFSGETENKEFVRVILGADYQFTQDVYALIEYQYNGEGTNEKSEYFDNFMRLQKGEIQNLGKNYLAAQSTYQVHPLVSSSLMLISNLGDGSGMLLGNIGWSALDNLSIGIGAMYVYGEDFTEYQFYPKSVYLTGEYFF